MLPVPYATEWKIALIVQVVFFAAILAVFMTSMLMRVFKVDANLRKTMLMTLYFFAIFSAFKIAGGICAVIQIQQDTPSKALIICTYIFDGTSLGFLLKTIVNYLNYMMFPRPPSGIPSQNVLARAVREFRGKDAESHYEYSGETTIQKDPTDDLRRFHPFRITTIVILAGVVLSIIGASNISDGTTSSSTAAMFKAASLLFLAALVLLFLLLVWTYSQHPNFRSGIAMILFSLVFYLVRVIYSITAAFTGISVSATKFNKFTFIFGDYKYYTFLGFLMELLISIVLLFVSHWFLSRRPGHGGFEY